MIYKTTKLADAVLSQIEWLESWGENDGARVEPYQNGREHGWCLYRGSNVVAFSENRNSDSIVIYFGKFVDFSMAGNVPSEEVYRRKKFFDYDKITEAARFIIEKLEKSQEPT